MAAEESAHGSAFLPSIGPRRQALTIKPIVARNPEKSAEPSASQLECPLSKADTNRTWIGANPDLSRERSSPTAEAMMAEQQRSTRSMTYRVRSRIIDRLTNRLIERPTHASILSRLALVGEKPARDQKRWM